MTEDQKNIGNKQIDTSTEILTKFFFHWALLSGATLTLAIPLLTEIIKIKGCIQSTYLIKISIGLLIISLITASLRNLIGGHDFWISGMANLNPPKTGLEENKMVKKMNRLNYIQNAITGIATISYIIAIVILFVFVSANIL